MVKIVFFFISLFSVLIFFQNCSKSKLEEVPLSEDLQFQKLESNLCLEGSLIGFTLESAIPISIGLKPYRDNWKRDSDFDGLSDEEEVALGFNKYNSRTTKGILDSVCFRYTNTNDCSNLKLNCTGDSIGFGLTDCDAELSGIDQLNNSSTKGIDTDKDGILDYIEFIRGTDPLVADAYKDPDNDKRSNWDEILKGGNINFFESGNQSIFNPNFTATKEIDSNCSAEFWKLRINTLPWVPGKASVNEGSNDLINSNFITRFNSEKDESLVLLVLKFKSTDLSVKNQKYFTKLITLKSYQDSIELNQNDFNFLGEITQ